MTSMFERAAVITLPRLEPHRPPVSSAIVARICSDAGLTTKSFDLNIDLYHKSRSLFDSLDSILDGYRTASTTEAHEIDLFLDAEIERIGSYEPDIILISVFSFTSHYFAKRLLEKLRHIAACKIIGGQGVFVPELSRQEQDRNTFGQTMLDNGLIDHYIVGEAEETLSRFLGGQRDLPGLDNSNPVQVMRLDDAPWPDYSYFDLDRYAYLDSKREVFVTSSRGCVRKCTYCDVPYMWPKYRWRSGENVANEMISHYEKHGITKFYFTDSLVNGSMKSFSDMCSRLANYKFSPGLSWSGQAIIRPKNQVSTEYFDMISAAGGKQFYIGVETGSDKIRWEMDKKFTNDDIQYHLENFSRTGINMFFLMLTGYVTETIDDHLDTLAMFPRWQHYVADGTIKGIDLGPTLIVMANTPLDHMREDLGIRFLNGDPKSWITDSNPGLTIKERVRRRIEIHEQAIRFNWPIWRGEQRLETIRDLIKGLGRDDGANYSTRINGAFD